MISIVYPSGAHGSFLKLLLNAMAGVDYTMANSSVYDFTTFNGETIFTATDRYADVKSSNIINIRVDPKSYLKYTAMCLTRTSGLDLVLEDLNINTFEKLKTHSIFSHLLSSLVEISGNDCGDVDIKYLREWARLCLFSNQGITISQWMAPSIGESDYVVDFECFYNNTLVEECQKILSLYNIKVVNKDVSPLINHFDQHNRYRLIDKEIKSITENILANKSYPIYSSNFLTESYIDNWLVEFYKVDPLLRNEYFTDTKQIIESYLL